MDKENKRDFSDRLGKYTIKELRQLQEKYGLKSKSGLKKTELIDTIIEELPSKYVEKLKWMDEVQIELIKGLVENNGEVNADILGMGAAYLEDYSDDLFYTHMLFIEMSPETFEMKLIMPQEIVQVLGKCDLKEEAKDAKKYSVWIKLMKGITRLYGVLKISDSQKILARLSGETVTKETFHKVFESAYAFNDLNYVEDTYIATAECFQLEEVLEEVHKRKNIDYKTFTRSKVMKYGSDEYFEEETEATGDFREYLKNMYNADEEICEIMISNIVVLIREGETFDGIMHFIASRFELPDEEALKEMTDYALAIYNTTGMWSQKGHTVKDIGMKKQSGLADIIDFVSRKKLNGTRA